MANNVNYSEKYDVFLSYRRDGGETMAILLRDRLVSKGYRVFLDIESLNSGSFNKKLLSVIEGCTDVVVVCSKNSLDRCANEGDWVRAEIAHALKNGKNVVPVMLRGFEWPVVLPDEIEELRMQNGVNANSTEYFEAAIDRLTSKFLQSMPHGSVTKKPKTPKKGLFDWFRSRNTEKPIHVIETHLSVPENNPAESIKPANNISSNQGDMALQGQKSDTVEESAPDSKSNLYGNTAGNLYNDGNAAIQGDWIYLSSGNMLYKTKADGSGGYTLLADNAPPYTARINVVGDWIYYEDAEYGVSRIKTNGTSKGKIFDKDAYNTTVVGNNLFYKKRLSSAWTSGFSLMKMDLQTGENKTIKSSVTQFAIFGDKIIGCVTYPTPVGAAKYSDCFVIDFDGNVIKTWREEHWIDSLSENNGYYYFVEKHDETLDGNWGSFIMKKPLNGDETVRLASGAGINILNDWIYFESVDGILCKMKTDGSSLTKLSNGLCTRFSIVGDWIFYQGPDNTSFKIKTDGTNKQQLP